jgi:hypothetical protein
VWPVIASLCFGAALLLPKDMIALAWILISVYIVAITLLVVEVLRKSGRASLLHECSYAN